MLHNVVYCLKQILLIFTVNLNHIVIINLLIGQLFKAFCFYLFLSVLQFLSQYLTFEILLKHLYLPWNVWPMVLWTFKLLITRDSQNCVPFKILCKWYLISYEQETLTIYCFKHILLIFHSQFAFHCCYQPVVWTFNCLKQFVLFLFISSIISEPIFNTWIILT